MANNRLEFRNNSNSDITVSEVEIVQSANVVSVVLYLRDIIDTGVPTGDEVNYPVLIPIGKKLDCIIEVDSEEALESGESMIRVHHDSVEQPSPFTVIQSWLVEEEPEEPEALMTLEEFDYDDPWTPTESNDLNGDWVELQELPHEMKPIAGSQ